MQQYTLHTHTIGFDGQNTVLEMANRAKELGFKTIGISNHFIVHPKIKKTKMYKYARKGKYYGIYASSFAEAVQHFIPLYEQIENIRNSNPGIEILRGMEVDFFDTQSWRDGFECVIKVLKPDYIIGATHFVEYNGSLFNAHDWANANVVSQEILLKSYWENIARAAQSGMFSWMAHVDLPKKVGLGRDEKWTEYESRAVEAIANAKCAIEINTSFYRPDCYEPYPSNRILQMVSDNGVPVLISDDAHQVAHLARHFDEAETLISKFQLQRHR